MTAFISIDNRFIAICHPYYYGRKITCSKYVVTGRVLCSVVAIFEVVLIATELASVRNVIFQVGIVAIITTVAYSYVRILIIIIKQRQAVRVFHMTSEPNK